MAASVGEKHAAARARSIEATTAALERDERVGAGFLAGSLGRGADDNWRDVDLVVVFPAGRG